jgi:hypothetical protein
MTEPNPSGSTASSAEKPPEPTRAQTIGCLAATAIVLLIVLATCVGGGDDDKGGGASSDNKPSVTETSKSPSESATQSPSESPTREKPATPQAQLEDTLDEADMLGDVKQVVVNMDTRTAVVTFAIADNLTNGLIRSGAKKDTMEIIAAAQEVKPKLRQLTVNGTFAMQDKYGKDLGQVKVMYANYEKVDLDNIQADNITIQDDVWDLASGGHFLHPAFE